MDDPLKREARQTAALDRLLEQVAATRPEPSAAFLDQLTAAADAAQPRPQPPAAPKRPGLSGWLQALGGWPAIGGLAAATLAGVWIGVAPPAPLEGYLTGSVSVDLMPGDPLGVSLALAEEG